MRKHYRLFAISILIAITATDVKAQIMSVMGEFSPSTSTLIGSASRIGYDDNNMSTYYMRYNDSSYFCSHYNYGYWAAWAPAVSSTKVTMPQDFIITDFKKFLSDPGYIGSYQGKGMYGYTLGYDLPVNNYFRIIKLTEVDRLIRTTVAHPAGQNAAIGMKFLSIGEKAESPNTTPRSYLLEYYLWGDGTYLYAPLAYNPQTNEQEIADDVITVGEYVVFATRDTRPNHTPVNLRISDTNNALSNLSHINEQWRFILPEKENVLGKVRLLSLNEELFILAYTIFNTNDDVYYLNIHLIHLPSFLNGSNSIISHEIKINKSCYDLTDLIFEPMVQTMVVLLNGEMKSEFYHLNPYSNTNDIATKMGYIDGNFYSIDTAGGDHSSNEVLYMAMGDDVIFLQNISNGINIVQSCLDKKITKYILREPPAVEMVKDPLNFYSEDQDYGNRSPEAPDFYGTRICNEVQVKNEY